MELVLVGDRPLTEVAFLSGTGPGSLVIDARKLTFASPLDLAGIVATAHWASGEAIQVTLRLPSDPDTAAYLQRMDVLQQVPGPTRIKGRPPSARRTDLRSRLMEVTPLSGDNVDEVVNRLGPLVTGCYRNCTGAGAAVFRACSELMINATEHGTSPPGAFLAAQLHSGRSTGPPRLEFAVCDTGIGILKHLRRNPRYGYLASDKLAIAKAIEAGVSGVASPGRGNGLSDTIKDTSKFGKLSFQIRSGGGEVRVSGTPGEQDSVVTVNDRQDQTSGTWAWLTHHLPEVQ